MSRIHFPPIVPSLLLSVSLIGNAQGAQASTMSCEKLFEPSEMDTLVQMSDSTLQTLNEVMNSWQARPEAVEGSVNVMVSRLIDSLTLESAQKLSEDQILELKQIQTEVAPYLNNTSGSDSKLMAQFKNRFLAPFSKRFASAEEKFKKVSECIGRSDLCLIKLNNSAKELEVIQVKLESLLVMVQKIKILDGLSKSSALLMEVFENSLQQLITSNKIKIEQNLEQKRTLIPALLTARTKLILDHPELARLMKTSQDNFKDSLRLKDGLLKFVDGARGISPGEGQTSLVSINTGLHQHLHSFYVKERETFLQNPSLALEIVEPLLNRSAEEQRVVSIWLDLVAEDKALWKQIPSSTFRELIEKVHIYRAPEIMLTWMREDFHRKSKLELEDINLVHSQINRFFNQDAFTKAEQEQIAIAFLFANHRASVKWLNVGRGLYPSEIRLSYLLPTQFIDLLPTRFIDQTLRTENRDISTGSRDLAQLVVDNALVHHFVNDGLKLTQIKDRRDLVKNYLWPQWIFDLQSAEQLFLRIESYALRTKLKETLMSLNEGSKKRAGPWK